MLPERWSEIKDKLHQALQLEPTQRAAYLAETGATDPDLQRELESLIASHERTGTDFLNAPWAQAASTLASPVEPEQFLGQRVGSYQIIGQIGVGGMGEVYRAVRADDEYKKQVAVKLVRAGQGSDFVINRFKNERQILASLDHPNIARLLDGGRTEEGVPYFVMELIQGQPIDDFCDEHKLPITDRLKLLLQVCSAVQYAHQRLIIHRDIKPSNILVTTEGVPKLLDFGIAKILDQGAGPELYEPTLTVFRVLTPGYASPEQIKGEPITITSDVYSLGVILYELLTGRSPYRVASRTAHELSRAACEDEPEKLSYVVRRTQSQGSGSPAVAPVRQAVARQSSPEKLSKRLGGDLDNIVLMALRKEPQRRYPSVEQFSLDIQRHLGNLPVMARRDTARYRTSKFVARHRVGVAAAAAILVILVLGMGVTLREARIARAQQERAERNFKDLREVSNSLVFDIHDAIRDLPGSTPARKMLVDTSLKYLDRLAIESGGDASLQRELAAAYERVAAVQGDPFGANVGDLEGAAASFRKAAVIWDSLLKTNAGNIHDLMGLARTYRQLAGTVANAGGGDPLDLMRKVMDVSERMESSASVDAQVAEELVLDYRHMAAIQIKTGGDPEGALTNCRKALRIAEQGLNSKPADRMLQRNVGALKGRMSEILAELGARDEALESSRQALEILRSLAKDPSDAWAQRVWALCEISRGDILLMNGDSAGGLQSYRQAQASLERLVASDSQNAQVSVELATAYAKVGHALSREGNGRAETMLVKATGILESMARDPQHTEARCSLAWCHIWLGALLAKSGETSHALENYRKGAADFAALSSLLPWDRYHRSALAASHSKIGGMLVKMGRPEEAAMEYQSALGIVRPLTLARPKTPLPWYTVAEAYSGMGDLSRMAPALAQWNRQEKRGGSTEACNWYQQSVEAWRQIPNPGAVTSAGFDVGDPTHAAKQLAVCKAALEKLKSSTAAPTESGRSPSPKPLH